MSDEKHFTALGLDIPTTNSTGRMIRRPAWHYEFDFSTNENCSFAMAVASMAILHSILRKQFCQLMLKNGRLHCKMNSIVLSKIKHGFLCFYLLKNQYQKANEFLI